LIKPIQLACMSEQRINSLQQSALVALVLLGLSLPFFWLHNVTVMPALYNEIVASIAWGVFLGTLIFLLPVGTASFGKISPVVAPAMALYILQILVLVLQYAGGKSIPYFGPVGMGLFVMAGGLLCLTIGAQMQGNLLNQSFVAKILLWAPYAVVIVGAIQMLFGWLQYLGISTNFPFISPLSVASRAYGNLRQPNQFALLLVLCTACMLWLADSNRAKSARLRSMLLWFAVFSIGAIALSASRTGFVLLCCMGIWGLFELKTSKRFAFSLLCAPLLYVAFRLVFTLLSQNDILVYYGDVRGLSGVSLSESANRDRIAFWNAAVNLIAEYPLLGVGYKRFAQMAFIEGHAFALTLHLENAHNLLLQWALNFGLPVALLLAGLLGYCFYKCMPLAKSSSGRTILFLLLIPVLQTMVEYPLDYIYFLFPWSFLLGVALVKASTLVRSTPVEARVAISGEFQQPSVKPFLEAKTSEQISVIVLLPFLLIVLPLLAAYDIKKILPLYDVTKTAIASERLTRAYDTVLFSYFADYAALGILPPSVEHSSTQLSLAKKVSYFRFDDYVASMYARSAALSGDPCLAKAIVYRIWIMDKKAISELKSTLSESSVPQLRSLNSFAQNPYYVVWPEKNLEECS
jgi:O-antigen ligase